MTPVREARELHASALWALHSAAQDAANDPDSHEKWRALRSAMNEATRTRSRHEFERTQELMAQERERLAAM